jgi:ABC-type sugar transport system substrate-binding protein
MAIAGRVGLFLADATNAYQQELVKTAEDAAKAFGLAVEAFFSAGDAGTQAVEIQRFIRGAPGGERSGVVVLPIKDLGLENAAQVEEHGFYKLASKAAARAVGFVVLNRNAEPLVDRIAARYPGVPVGMVRPDGHQIGSIQAQQFRRLMPKAGQLLYVMGNPMASSTHHRYAGMAEGLAGWTDAIAKVDGYWNAEEAEKVVHKWITSAAHRNAELHLVGCQNDHMAEGAIAGLERAARETGRADLRSVPVTGIDGVAGAGRAWVDRKKLAATVVMAVTSATAVTFLAQAWSLPGATKHPRVSAKTVMPSESYPSIDSLAPRG